MININESMININESMIEISESMILSVCIMYVCKMYILDVCVFDDCVAVVGVQHFCVFNAQIWNVCLQFVFLQDFCAGWMFIGYLFEECPNVKCLSSECLPV